MESEYSPVLKYVLPGVLLSAVFTAIIAVTAMNLTGFEIIGKTVPFAYPWRLTEPNAMARMTAWGLYLTHNVTDRTQCHGQNDRLGFIPDAQRHRMGHHLCGAEAET